MPITKDAKKTILQGLVDKFARSKSVVFTEYRGLKVKGISDLRKRLRSKNAEMQVAKKTLMKLAAKENHIEEIADAILEGPVSATFSYEDDFGALQILFKFSKENENLKLLGGIINGKVVDAETIKKYAKLPSKEELLAKFMSSLQSPASGFVSILNNLIAGFVRVLKAHHDKQAPHS